MKILFLDIDGVLVTRSPGVFETELVMNLRHVIEATGAQIVLSSDWRRERFSIDQARRNLQMYGLDCIACTPSLSPYVKQRPTEILQWRDEYCRSNPITNWIAIDDRNLLEERDGFALRGHFVHINPMIGLDSAAAYDCIHLLNQPESRDNFFRHQPESRDNFGRPISNSLSNSWARTHATIGSSPSIYSSNNLNMDFGAETKSRYPSFDLYAQPPASEPLQPRRSSFDAYGQPASQEAYGSFRMAMDTQRPLWVRSGGNEPPARSVGSIAPYLFNPYSSDRTQMQPEYTLNVPQAMERPPPSQKGLIIGDLFGSIDNVFRVYD